MTIAVKYVGKADGRVIPATVLAAAGLTGLPDLNFSKVNNYTNNVDGLTAAFLMSQVGEFLADDVATSFTDTLAAALATRTSLAPIMKQNSTANWTLTGTNTWVDSDPTGSPPARTYDVVIPGVKVGDWIQLIMDAYLLTGTVGFFVDWWTYVLSTPVRNLSGVTNGGPASLLLPAGSASALTSTLMFQLQAGDIDAGVARCRLRHFGASSSRLLLGGSGFQMHWEGRGPFG